MKKTISIRSFLLLLFVSVQFLNCSKKEIPIAETEKEDISINEIKQWGDWYSSTYPDAPKFEIDKAQKATVNKDFLIRVPLANSNGFIYFNKNENLESVFIRTHKNKNNSNLFEALEYINLNSQQFNILTYKNNIVDSIYKTATPKPEISTKNLQIQSNGNFWFDVGCVLSFGIPRTEYGQRLCYRGIDWGGFFAAVVQTFSLGGTPFEATPFGGGTPNGSPDYVSPFLSLFGSGFTFTPPAEWGDGGGSPSWNNPIWTNPNNPIWSHLNLMLTPVSETSIAIQEISDKIPLTEAQIEFLYQNPTMTDDLTHWLNETDLDESAIIGVKIALELGRLGIEDSPLDQAYEATLMDNIPPNRMPLPSIASLTLTMKYSKLLAANAALLKEENPTWSTWKILWEASAESMHLLLQVGGLLPVVGVIFDIGDAGLYIVQGDGKNATLAAFSAVPLVGDYFRGANLAKKTLNLVNGSKVVLKSYVVGNKIFFSGRSQLRKVLGLVKGDIRVAHHIIPWEWRDNAVIQMAAKAGFHMNEALNGIPSFFSGNHPSYNARVAQKLADINDNLLSLGQWNPTAAKSALEKLANDIRAVLEAHPSTPLDQLIHLF